MKQCDLCDLANVPKSSLSLYLSGAYEPKQDRLCLMAIALDVSEAWLMGYDVPMERGVNQSQKTVNLSENEQLVLDLFRRVPDDKKQMVVQMITIALGNQK